MKYFEYKFKLKDKVANASEILIAFIAEYGFESFMENEDDKTVSAYIASDFCENGKMQFNLTQKPYCTLVESYSILRMEDKNWNQEWEKEFTPVIIDEKCIVRAPFHELHENIEFDIVIMPKMSFGTAHHETTFMMIKYILEIENIKGKDVLDMGCGTGVLAILASLKGASHIDAIDNDEWAYRNTLENVITNNQKINVLLGNADDIPNHSYDYIFANINRNILVADMSKYAKHLKEKGTILFSGFYKEDLKVIESEANKVGLQLVSTKNKNNWLAAEFIKK